MKGKLHGSKSSGLLEMIPKVDELREQSTTGKVGEPSEMLSEDAIPVGQYQNGVDIPNSFSSFRRQDDRYIPDALIPCSILFISGNKRCLQGLWGNFCKSDNW
jgi:hypothetical protein